METPHDLSAPDRSVTLLIVGDDSAAAERERRRLIEAGYRAAIATSADEVRLAVPDRFARFAAVAPGVIYTFRMAPDGHWSLPYASPGLVDIYGLRPEDVAADAAPLIERIHPDDRERVLAANAQAASTLTVWHCEYRVCHPAKGDVWVEGRSAPGPEPDGGVLWHGVLTDITERKRAEFGGQRQTEILQKIFDNAPIGIGFLTADSRFALANREWERIVGWTLKELAEQNRDVLAEVLPGPEEHRRARERIAEATGDVWDLRVRTRDGSTVDVSSCIVALSDGTRIALLQDITERKRAEAALRANQQLLQSVLTTLPVGVSVTDPEGNIVLANEAVKRIWGDVIVAGRERWTRSWAVWHGTGTRVAPDAWPSARALAEGRTSLNELIDIEAFDGRKKTIQSSAAPVRSADGVVLGAVIVNEDVTERMRAEQALAASAGSLRHLSRRLLEVQEEERRHLARELHDEFGQLLAAVGLNLHAIRGTVGELAGPLLEDSLAVLRRAGDLVRDLALRLRPAVLETAGLGAAVRWLAEQHQRQTGIVTRVEGNAGDAPGDQTTACFRVAQEALTNVVRHAQARHVWIELNDGAGVLELVVRDDGVGFDPDRISERGAAWGRLGLLGMRERVELFQGRLEVNSAPGRGTLIRAVFPVTRTGGAPAPPAE